MYTIVDDRYCYFKVDDMRYHRYYRLDEHMHASILKPKRFM